MSDLTGGAGGVWTFDTALAAVKPGGQLQGEAERKCNQEGSVKRKDGNTANHSPAAGNNPH